jgi:hypothetical protein
VLPDFISGLTSIWFVAGSRGNLVMSESAPDLIEMPRSAPTSIIQPDCAAGANVLIGVKVTSLLVSTLGLFTIVVSEFQFPVCVP